MNVFKVVSERFPPTKLVGEGWGTLITLAGLCRRYSLKMQRYRLKGIAGISYEVMMGMLQAWLETSK